MAHRPNFYTLLEIDPSVDDWPTLEHRIREKRRAWSLDRSQGHPKARRRAETALALLPEIERIFQDPVSRRREASEAGREQQRAQQRELADSVELLNAGGGKYSEGQFQSLVQRFSGVWAPAELREQLRAAGIQPIQPETAVREVAPPAEPPFDKVVEAHLHRNLVQLGFATLYDFLGLPPESSPATLVRRAHEIYQTNLRTGRTDADNSARNELAGLAATIFKDDLEKSRYDQQLATAAAESLAPLLELAGSDGSLSALELDALLRHAQRRGISTAVARRLIERYAAARNWRIEADDPIEAPAEPEPFLYGKEGLFSPGIATSRTEGAGVSAEHRKLASVVAKRITNVASKSFGIVVLGPDRREIVRNLFLADEAVPKSSSLPIEVREDGLQSMEIRCVESSSRERQVPLSACREIGKVSIELDPPPLQGARVEITFKLGPEGLLTLEGKDFTGASSIRPTFLTAGVLPQQSLAAARDRNTSIRIAPLSHELASRARPRPPELLEKIGGPRNQVFVSYSHADIRWLERLQKHMKQLVRTDTISLWDDTKIKPGDDWKKEIQRALEQAKVAILLVSPDFINSDFIVEHELPQLLKAARKKHDLRILWLCLSHCLVEETEIMDFKAANNPGRPLASLRRRVDQDAVLIHLCRLVKEAINDDKPASTKV